MAKDDFFVIAYAILYELYGCMKEGTKVDLGAIRPERFQVNGGYLLSILDMLLGEGYVKGFQIKGSKTGNYVVGLEDIEITIKGIEYLSENTALKQVQKAMKGIKDAIPGI